MGGKNKLESGRAGGVRLWSSAQLGIYTGTLPAEGAHHLPLELPHGNNAEPALGPAPWLQCQHRLAVALLPPCACQQQRHSTPLSETTDSTETDEGKLAQWLGWRLHLQRKGGNGDSNSLLNPGIWRRQKELSFLAPPLHLPSLYHGAASLRIDLFYGSIWGEYTMHQAQFKVLGIYLWTKPRLLSLTNILLEE